MTPASKADLALASNSSVAEFSHSEPLAPGSVTQWLDLFRTGNDEAVQRLWDRYFSALVSVAHAKFGSLPGAKLDAEDAALSAFHTLYRAASSNRLTDILDREGLWQSLIVIASGKVVDTQRRAMAQKRGGGQTVTDSFWIEAAQSEATDPAVAALIQEQFEALMDLLPDVELKQIALLKLEGFTNAEIAHQLNCGERTVKRRLSVIRRLWEEKI